MSEISRQQQNISINIDVPCASSSSTPCSTPLPSYRDQVFVDEKRKPNVIPTPIGLLAFGMTTIMLVYSDLGWEEEEFVDVVQGYGLFYGGLVLFLAGWGELCIGNTFTATAFVSYGASRMTWFLARQNILDSDGDINFPTIVTNLFLGLFTAGFFAIALFKKPLITKIVFGALTIMFFCSIGGLYFYVISLSAKIARCVSAVAACYGAIALVIKDEIHVVLPGLKA